jgi:hypothetical protein
MDRSLTLHALAAVGAAGLALAAWKQPAEDKKDDGVTVAKTPSMNLGAITWKDDAYDVEVTKSGERVQVAVTQKTGLKDGGPPPKARVFPGSKRATELFQSFAPFKAARHLGPPDPSKLGALGLEKPTGRLTLTAGAESATIEVGGTTFGSGDRYAKGPDGDVYLLKATNLNDLLHGGASLTERALLDLEAKDVERATLTLGAKGRELLQRNPGDKDNAFWADPAVPDEKLEQASGWMDRLLKLRIADLADAKPSTPPALVVELFGAKGSLAVIEVFTPDDKVAVATAPRFMGPVTIAKANAEALIRDAEKVADEGR